jgi:hypothetical protein
MMSTAFGDGDEMDMTKLLMPKLQWHKQLKPEADEAYLNMLGLAEEKGLPIPMRIWAAAAGLSLPEIMMSLDEDINLRKKIDKYNKSKPKSAQEEMDGMFSGASVNMRKKNRNFDSVEVRDPTTGKLLSRKGHKVIADRMHKNAAKALANIAKRDNGKEKDAQKAARKRIYSYLKKHPGAGPYGKL